MKTAIYSLFIFFYSFLVIKNQANPLWQKHVDVPKAKQIIKELSIHGDVRMDEFYWLNDRENPEVVEYLNNENEYYEAKTAHTDDFQKSLFEEMKARIKEDDSSVPYKYNGYWYITKYEKGKDYPIYTRKKESLDADEELLFDCNEMAKGILILD